MSALPTQPQSIGKTLDRGIKLYIRGLAKVFPISLFVAIIGVLPDVVRFRPSMLGGIDPGAVGVTMLVYFVIMIVLAVSIYAGIIRYYGDLAAGGIPTVGASVKAGFRKFFPIILASILYVIAVTLGMIALFVPGLILALSLYLCSTAIMIDNKGIIESLKFSHGLVWGNWWRSAAVLTVPILIAMALYGILMTVLGVNMAMMAGVNNAVPDQMQVLFWFSLAAAVVNSIIYPLFYAVTVVLYHDLKLRKGGSDLEARLASA